MVPVQTIRGVWYHTYSIVHTGYVCHNSCHSQYKLNHVFHVIYINWCARDDRCGFATTHVDELWCVWDLYNSAARERKAAALGPPLSVSGEE